MQRLDPTRSTAVATSVGSVAALATLPFVGGSLGKVILALVFVVLALTAGTTLAALRHPAPPADAATGEGAAGGGTAGGSQPQIAANTLDRLEAPWLDGSRRVPHPRTGSPGPINH